jgi:hypothetical protein
MYRVSGDTVEEKGTIVNRKTWRPDGNDARSQKLGGAARVVSPARVCGTQDIFARRHANREVSLL